MSNFLQFLAQIFYLAYGIQILYNFDVIESMNFKYRLVLDFMHNIEFNVKVRGHVEIH